MSQISPSGELKMHKRAHAHIPNLLLCSQNEKRGRQKIGKVEKIHLEVPWQWRPLPKPRFGQ